MSKAQAQDIFPQGPPLPFGQLKVAYPQNEGAVLGEGWDFLRNQKTYSTCIAFSQNEDHFQNASLQSQETIDQETLDVSLNAAFSTSARGNAGVFAGSAETSLKLNTTYHYASKDLFYVAQASVTNGALSAGPPQKIAGTVMLVVKIIRRSPAEMTNLQGE